MKPFYIETSAVSETEKINKPGLTRQFGLVEATDAVRVRCRIIVDSHLAGVALGGQ